MQKSCKCTGIIVLAQNRVRDYPGCMYEPRIEGEQLNVQAVMDEQGSGLRVVAQDKKYGGKTLRPHSKRILSERHFWDVFNQLKDWK